MAAFGMEEDGSIWEKGQEDPNSGWETAAMDTGETAADGGQGGASAGNDRVKPQKATRGNRTKRQKKRKVVGLEKALAVSERAIAKVRKVEKKMIKKNSLKNLWESGRASDAAA